MGLYRGEEAAAADDEVRTFGNGDCLVEAGALLGGGAVLVGLGVFLWETYQLAEKMNISYLEAGKSIIDLFQQ